jgi:CYTH domain
VATVPTSIQSRPPTVAGYEIERQWRAHPALHLPSRIGTWSAVDGHYDRLVDTYYDTRDLLLDGRRARLRLRRTTFYEVATLKRRVTATGGIRHRIEIEGPYDGDPETSVAFVAARLLTMRPLFEIGSIVTARTTRIYESLGRRVEMVRDHVSYATGGDEWRVEAEGAAADVNELAELLEDMPLGLQPVRRGKVQTMLRRAAA